MSRARTSRSNIRSAENDRDRLAAVVTELIRRPVAVIVGNVVAAVAAKAATTTVPIVFATGSDPVKTASSPVSTGRVATSRA